jgi:purine-cytosine permease-like protein
MLFTEALSGGSLAKPILSAYSSISFALAVELSIAMPVSWLPLVGDYACKANNKTTAFAIPFAAYFSGSVIMYLFGLYIAVTSGSDIFSFIASSKIRFAACAVVALSTLTTAFLDLYSAAISSKQLVNTKNSRIPILAIGIITIIVSTFFPVEKYGDFLTAFLTLIGMVFVPVYAILFLDFARKKSIETKKMPLIKLLIAIAGMAAWQIFTHYGFGIPTVCCIAIVAGLYFIGTRRCNTTKL